VSQNDTKSRIVEAAIEVFLEKGYDATTIRDICDRAEVNLASVNYHFGSKDALRTAALESIMAANTESYPLADDLDETSPPEERLRLFIRNLLRRIFPKDPEHARRSRLFWMELGNPSRALEPQVERFMRPIKDSLEAIIAHIIGPADSETIRLCVGSIVGQQLFHAQNRAIMNQLYGEITYQPHDVELLAEHIFRFSLAGLNALKE
jgi:AcrR family transcriptional regulator